MDSYACAVLHVLTHATKHSKATSTPFCVHNHHRGKRLQRFWQSSEGDSSAQTKAENTA